MLLLSALWLAVVQALATLAAPAGLHGPVDAPWRLAGVEVSVEGVSAGHARTPTADSALWALLAGGQEFRPSAPQRLPGFDRRSERGAPPLRSPLGLAGVSSAGIHLSLASLAPPARYQVSHAAASRGGHLPYYPTAPPLQG